MVDETDLTGGKRPETNDRTRTLEQRLRRRARRLHQTGQPLPESGELPQLENTGPDLAARSSGRLNRIAELVDAKSYLEIGVATGRTFFAVRVPHKVAVDPKFRFNVSAHKAPGVHFHKTTSDDFFRVHPETEKFDLIFIDGLHTFDQTLRDFRNAITLSHNGTVFVIDDVMPVDEYSASPDREKGRQLRMQAGDARKGKGGWHGDVYKVVFAIHDLHPEFSFVTAVSRGNVQTIVWRAPRENVVPVYGSIEAIDKIDFGELGRRKSFFNLQSEENALRMLSAAVKLQPDNQAG